MQLIAPKVITVGELRRALDGVEDNTPVLIQGPDTLVELARMFSPDGGLLVEPDSVLCPAASCGTETHTDIWGITKTGFYLRDREKNA